MIPELITETHVLEAIRRIGRDGIPPRRRSRDYCVVSDGKHLPPKYVIALAHEAATGEFLSSEVFSGGTETNNFLVRRGFEVVECSCGGGVHDGGGTRGAVSAKARSGPVATTRHSERCPECKRRVRELLERIYGYCLPNHGFRWRTDLAAYAGTSIDATLRNVAEVLESYRGFGIAEFVRRKTLAPCDFWVPNPGFVVEFDESQHFTKPRKLALSVYADMQPLGFSAMRWMERCDAHDAKDNDPPYRDEQRAWYDTLRDLVPSTKTWRPTVRLYARELEWCSLDPDDSDDRERFSRLIAQGTSPGSRTAVEAPARAAQSASNMRVAMVFPGTNEKSSNGVPPSGSGAQQPAVPAAAAFAGEAVDFVLFPEGYIRSSDKGRIRSLKKLASDLGAPLLVGAIDTRVDSTGRAWQVLLRFDPDGSSPSRVYVKHSTADAVAFERPDWEPHDALPTFELGGVIAGATICHDSYLGLLPRYLAGRGARLWVNPSFDNVTDIKWSSVLRLRAVENRFFALCTLHCDANRRRTRPFAFAPDGTELAARRAGSEVARPLSECGEAGNIFVVDLDLSTAGEPLDWSTVPPACKPKRARRGQPRKPVRVALRDGQRCVLGSTGWNAVYTGGRVETERGPVYVGIIPGAGILDAAECFRVLDRARQTKGAPIIWNHWERLPADSARLATLMLGRAIECCAPIVISDRDGMGNWWSSRTGTRFPPDEIRSRPERRFLTRDMRGAWTARSEWLPIACRRAWPELHWTAIAVSGSHDAAGQKHSARAAGGGRRRGRRGGILGPAQHSRGIAHNAKLCVRSSSPSLAGFPSVSSMVRGVWFPATRLRQPFFPPRAARRHRAVARRPAAFSARDGGLIAPGDGAVGAPHPVRRRDAP